MPLIIFYFYLCVKLLRAKRTAEQQSVFSMKNTYRTAAATSACCVCLRSLVLWGKTTSISQKRPSSWSHAPCLHVQTCRAWCCTWPGSSWWAESSATTVSWGCGACSHGKSVNRLRNLHSSTLKHTERQWCVCGLTQNLCLPSDLQEVGRSAPSSSCPAHRRSLVCWQRCDLNDADNSINHHLAHHQLPDDQPLGVRGAKENTGSNAGSSTG